MRVYDGKPGAGARRLQCLLAGLLGCMVLGGVVPSTARADTVALRNGDQLTGTITGIDAGRLVLKTGYAGEVKIDLRAIDRFSSSGEMTSILKTEKRLFGRVSGDGESVRIEPVDGGAERSVATSELIGFEQGHMRERDVRLSGRINVGASRSSGNTEVTRLNVDSELIARRSANRFTLGLRGTSASDHGRQTESNAVATLKYDRFITPRWYGYASSTFEYDPFSDIRLRSTYGVGSGYQLIESQPTNLALEGGLDYVHTDFYDGADESFPAARLALRFDHWLIEGRMQFFHKSEGYASLERIEQSFVRTQTGLRFPLWDSFLAQAQLNYDWDGDPQPERKAVDQQVVFSLGYKW